jgi:quinol monooxygenase YgiN
MEDGPIIVVSRGVVKQGRRDALIPHLRSITEQDEQESGTLLRAIQCERDDQKVIWGLSVYRDAEARDTSRRSRSPIVESMEGLWEQWPRPTYCVPITAKVSDDLRDAWDTPIDDGPIMIVTRGVATHGRRDDLFALLREMHEQDEQEVGTLLHANQCERDDPSVVWGLTIYRDVEARNIHWNNLTPKLPTREGLWEQWPHPIYCLPIAAKISDGLRDAWPREVAAQDQRP